MCARTHAHTHTHTHTHTQTHTLTHTNTLTHTHSLTHTHTHTHTYTHTLNMRRGKIPSEQAMGSFQDIQKAVGFEEYFEQEAKYALPASPSADAAPASSSSSTTSSSSSSSSSGSKSWALNVEVPDVSAATEDSESGAAAGPDASTELDTKPGEGPSPAGTVRGPGGVYRWVWKRGSM